MSSNVPTDPGRHDMTIEADGVERHYILFVPASYDGSTAVPLVFFFHGAGEDAENAYTVRKDLRDLAEERNYIYVIPNGQSESNNDGGPAYFNAGWCCIDPSAPSDVEFFRRMVSTLRGGLNIDPNRIHPMGFSNGCSLAHRIAADAPDLVASAACSSGSVGGQETEWPEYVIQPTAPVPFAHAHGTADVVVPYDGSPSQVFSLTPYSFDTTISLWVANNGCGTTPTQKTIPAGAFTAVVDSYGGCTNGADVVGLTVQGMGHQWPAFATVQMVDFLLTHPKS
jgi:polyhydroxybutyrate depolymerase